MNTQNTHSASHGDHYQHWEREIRGYLSQMPELYGAWPLPEGFLSSLQACGIEFYPPKASARRESEDEEETERKLCFGCV
jgi:hypothetical protein